MRKLIILIMIAGSGLWVGCGGNDSPTQPPAPTITTVTAATGTTAPNLFNPSDTVWNRITATTVSIAGGSWSNIGKIRPQTALAVASSVGVKALAIRDTLYLKISWSDDTEDIWPDYFEVDSLVTVGSDILAFFGRGTVRPFEDQLMVFLKPPAATTWDVINYRTATTGGGNLAEEFNWTGTSLSRDDGIVELSYDNEGTVAGYPAYMPANAPTDESFLSVFDAVEAEFDTDSVAWSVGDRVAGWMINDSLHLASKVADRSSRFGTMAGHAYSGATTAYTVVLSRPLGTTFGDDADLSSYANLNMRVGITNGSAFHLSEGSASQGFTAAFNLVLP